MERISPGKLARCFDATAGRLVLYARTWLPEGHAEDLVQDAFIRLMRQKAEPENVRAWLFRVVRNAALTQLRSDHRRRKREHLAAEGRAAWFEIRPDDLIDAEHARAVLGALPREQREVALLRIWGGLTLQEIANIVDKPVSTVFSRYRAALAALRKGMGARCRTEPS